ncbi:hypothetical protein ANO11243_066390 [Dothideomycetidae sp. 11243]|nr:hypothetical protein ANO11243_066390 [fungal sp. No.11243]
MTLQELMPRCIASTEKIFSDHTISATTPDGDTNCFRLAQLSPDGTSIVTYSEDQRLRTFVLPTTLLDSHGDDPHQLEPYSTSRPFSSHSFVLYPGFNLQDPRTTLVLQSRADVPIRLTNALDLNYSHASYPLINPTTEAFICPHSLTFTRDCERFVAGAKETIAVFDISRDGQGPVSTFATRSGRKARKSYGEAEIGLSGLVTAMDISGPTTALAAGSTGAQVAIYDLAGSGEKITSFSLETDCTGVSQVKWDGTGNYLFVAGRQSNSLSVYNMRSGRRQCLLTGRFAKTTQRMGFQLVQTMYGCDVWAGGTDGNLRIWKNVLSKEGSFDATETLPIHADAVSNIMVHDSGSVFLTTCGQRNEVWPLDKDGSENGDPTGHASEACLKALATQINEHVHLLHVHYRATGFMSALVNGLYVDSEKSPGDRSRGRSRTKGRRGYMVTRMGASDKEQLSRTPAGCAELEPHKRS